MEFDNMNCFICIHIWIILDRYAERYFVLAAQNGRLSIKIKIGFQCEICCFEINIISNKLAVMAATDAAFVAVAAAFLHFDLKYAECIKAVHKTDMKKANK